MLTSSRQDAINHLIFEQGAVDVTDLASRFAVSASTIRRDLEQLEKRGQIRRVHGGATLPGGNQSISKTKNIVQSAGSIGRAAANRIRADETVFFGPGRLTLEAVKILASRSDITVVTNCLDIAYWLFNHSRLNIILTGGMARRQGKGLQGPLVTNTLKTLRAERAFFEPVGISPDLGLTCRDLEEVDIYRNFIQAPGETIALVPPECVGRVGGVVIGPATDVDVVITGRDASEALLWDLSQLGITIISV